MENQNSNYTDLKEFKRETHNLESNLKVDLTVFEKEIVPKLNNGQIDENGECEYDYDNMELSYIIEMVKNNPEELILHWGFNKEGKSQWAAPDNANYNISTASKPFDAMAVQNSFSKNEDLNIEIKVNAKNKITGFSYVFNNPTTKKWYNNNNKDFAIKFNNLANLIKQKKKLANKNPVTTEDSEELTEAEIPQWVMDVIDCEVNHGSWTLMHRYNKCFDVLNSVDIHDSHPIIYVFIWLRYSYTRHLDWQRRFNTKPRELAHSMNRLTHDITSKIAYLLREKKFTNSVHKRTSNDCEYGNITSFEMSSYDFLRYSLAMLGKGNGDGQKIRDEILVILHKHHIKETNDHFYEQWHQKLHNNTTPDDVDICQALLNYLKAGGNINVYWDSLKKSGITRERLASFERKIVSEPYYNPSLIPDFENFLNILKAVHSSNDLILMFDSGKYALGNEYKKVEEIISNRNDWDTIKQMHRVTDGRMGLTSLIYSMASGQGPDMNKLRDLLFLDLALENYMRQLVEKIIHISLEFELYVDQLSMIIKNILANFKNYTELGHAANDWFKIVEPLKKSLTDNSLSVEQRRINVLKIKSVADRLGRCLSHVIDFFNKYVDKKARFLGSAFHAEEFTLNLFTEEIVRGSIFFALSMVLKKIDPFLRKAADLGNWKIISPAPAAKNVLNGNFDFVKNLKDVQFKTYPKNTILLAEYVGGNEEVPANVDCLIIVNGNDYPDTLAHVSVRARNLSVPLMVCFEEEICGKLKALVGKSGFVKFLTSDNITFGVSDGAAHATSKNGNGVAKEFDEKLDLQDNSSSTEHKKITVDKKGDPSDIESGKEKISIELTEFSKELAGAKSNNTKVVFGNLPDWVYYPESFAIPFNVMEYFLRLPENQEVLRKIEEEISKIKTTDHTKIAAHLGQCKKYLSDLKFVENEITAKLKQRILSFGVTNNEFNKAWDTLKKVWASKFNERVYISTLKIGVSIDDIKMSVLVQKVVEADYAFVIHTKDPVNNDPNVLYAEIVVGLGETLVGTFEGQAFSFAYYKNTNTYKILSFPNKSVSLKNTGFIFRSDSNTEDLNGFAGAGLFDSITLYENKDIHNEYNNCEIFTNEKFRHNVIVNIAKLGIEVEKIYNFPQDIEGCVSNNKIFIVQTRPQV